MDDFPENAPSACPGVGSSTAGLAGPCQGCPNQVLCSTKPQGPDPDIEVIKSNMIGIRHKILVLSGKGGVGKSMVAAHLARALAAAEDKNQISLLDVDICGPSIPTIMGVEGEEIHQSASGWSQVYVSDNLGVMSVGFLLDSPDAAVVWRGPRKNGLIKQFLREVDWGTADYMIVDTPPGTSDEHLSIVQFLAASGIDGAIIVTTPQEVSLMDVRKEINFCRKVKIPIIGLIENMSAYICPKCQTKTDIFAPTSGGGKALSKSMDVEFLGSVPVDPMIGKTCDAGESFLESFPDSLASKAFDDILKNILMRIEH